MKTYAARKSLSTQVVNPFSFVFFLNIDLQTFARENSQFLVILLLLLISCWLLSFYALVNPILRGLLLKKIVINNIDLYTPSLKETNVRKDFFNLRVFPDANTVDILDEECQQSSFIKTRKQLKYVGFLLLQQPIKTILFKLGILELT